MPGVRRRGHAFHLVGRHPDADRRWPRPQRKSRPACRLFLQISDTHIGFNKEANPDVAGTLKQTIALVNAMKTRPALTIHTGDITHLSSAAEFDTARRSCCRTCAAANCTPCRASMT